MATIHEALLARADAHGLGGLIGTPPRLFPGEAPQDIVAPYAVYQQISGARVQVMMRDTLSRPRFQFEAWGRTRAEAQAVAAQLLACFDRWAGIAAGVTVQVIVVVSDGVDVGLEETTDLRGVSQDYEVTYVLA